MLAVAVGIEVLLMSARADPYSSRSEGDSIEELSKRLTADLRRHIRALVSVPRFLTVAGWVPFVGGPNSFVCGAQGPCDVLSERWIEVGDCLGRVATVSQMV